MQKALSDTFAALADPTRRGILAELARGEASAGQLNAPFKVSQPAISRHLKVLEQAGLVTARRDGTRRMFRLSPHRLQDIDTWLDLLRHKMDAKYDRLDALLAQTEDKT